jgi:hypothetical protein
MSTLLRRSTAFVALLALGACAGDSVNAPDTDLLANASIDPSIGAEAGQAGTLGLTIDPASTFAGSLGDASSCAFVVATGRVECAPVSRGGLTITRSIAFRDAAGTVQPARTDATVSANTRITVSGTTTTPAGAVTVARSSDLTLSGLGRGTTTHTLNGVETGKSSGTLTTPRGSIDVTETSTSQTENVVVPAPATAGSFPLSGSTTRSGTTTATRTGTAESHTSTWSERVTYTGTSVANVTITRDGRTRTCTRDLAARTSTCN